MSGGRRFLEGLIGVQTLRGSICGRPSRRLDLQTADQASPFDFFPALHSDSWQSDDARRQSCQALNHSSCQHYQIMQRKVVPVTIAVKCRASPVLCDATPTWVQPMMAATSSSQAAVKASSSYGGERVFPAWTSCNEQKLVIHADNPTRQWLQPATPILDLSLRTATLKERIGR